MERPLGQAWTDLELNYIIFADKKMLIILVEANSA